MTRLELDAKRFAELDKDECQLCHTHGPDMRTLLISCFYAVHEVAPEAIDLRECQIESLRDRGYYLRICKTCRAAFLLSLGQWHNKQIALRDVPKDADGGTIENDDERNIPVRVNGAIKLLTRQEWDEYVRQRTSTTSLQLDM